jgi:hypothetical protein
MLIAGIIALVVLIGLTAYVMFRIMHEPINLEIHYTDVAGTPIKGAGTPSYVEEIPDITSLEDK